MFRASTSARKFGVCVLAFAIVGVTAWMCARRAGGLSSQALAVRFLGYTNAPQPGAVFAVSNQWNRPVKCWCVVYLEGAPFRTAGSPLEWRMDHRSSIPECYLRPGETEVLLVQEPPPAKPWRLRVPWSKGLRAKICSVFRRYSYLPLFLRAAPEYYACSEPISD